MILPTISDFDITTAQLAAQRQSVLTKPSGSLGKLENLSIQLAGITGFLYAPLDQKVVIIMAADHGVTAEGVSAYPSEVTRQMVFNFLNGGAAINVLCRQAGARVQVVDMGVATDFENIPGLAHHKVAYGTKNLAIGPAMTNAQAEEAILTGIKVVNHEIDAGLDIVATGDMGIGNTTPSACIASAMTGLPPKQIAGRGTGVDDQGLKRKISIVERALEINKPNPQDAMDVLCKVGGFEIAGLAGVMIGAASQRKPVVVDGFISTAAALIAVGLSPNVQPYLIAAHCSVENGHRAMLDHLHLEPLLDLNLRLGEGTGAVLAFHLAESAVRILREMATFEEAGVSQKE
jgi:nicotinate-nucleotide--dimethylbenzimidazole phosphoribosyltransferase